MIRKPTGCGEQTMSAMGPLVYALKYMEQTDTLRSEVEEVAYEHVSYGE
jgi:hypothetical protein